MIVFAAKRGKSMSVLINCREIEKSFSNAPLFSGLTFSVHSGDRIGVIGNNGAGKSTLMKILAGVMEPDSGQVAKKSLLRMAYLEQEEPSSLEISVQDYLTQSGRLIGIDEGDLAFQVPAVLSRAGFDDLDCALKSLSGGWFKRLSICRALLGDPDVVLLDEPTNHLDLEGVLWLEQLLNQAKFAWVLISHDRFFLDRTVKTIAEVNRAYPGGLFRQDSSYSKFLELRQEYFEGLASKEASLSNRVRREVEWLRQGVKARTTRSRSRVDQAHQMMSDLKELRGSLKKTESKVSFTSSQRKTKRLLVAEGISKSYEGKTIFQGLDLLLSPGMVVGVLGPNGCGKSTLLKAVQKLIPVDSGTVDHAPDLRIVYFDQSRDQLDDQAKLKEALTLHGGDSVIYREKSVHIASWARRFQFEVDQLEQPLSALSGGEKARVLIARLMQQEADILILDEPTNDLDIQTLEVLEESLSGFPGCVVLVSHDRYFMSQLTDLSVGFLGQGQVQVFAGYEQWEAAFAQSLKQVKPKVEKAPKKRREVKAKVKLSYMEQREYNQMEENIQKAEENLELVQAEVDESDGTSSIQVQELYTKLQEAQEKVESLYARWAELEAKQQV